MRRFWDAIAGVVVGMFTVYLLLSMVRPYIPFMLLGLLVFFIGRAWFRYSRNW